VTSFVIDASITLAWCFEDEATDQTDAILVLARTHILSAYDAAYLELAIRRSLPLATLDHELSRACHIAGVTLVPERAPSSR
jgi:predicted nucleic acid-binding protein